MSSITRKKSSSQSSQHAPTSYSPRPTAQQAVKPIKLKHFTFTHIFMPVILTLIRINRRRKNFLLSKSHWVILSTSDSPRKLFNKFAAIFQGFELMIIGINKIKHQKSYTNVRKKSTSINQKQNGNIFGQYLYYGKKSSTQSCAFFWRLLANSPGRIPWYWIWIFLNQIIAKVP